MSIRRTVQPLYGSKYFDDAFPLFVNRATESFEYIEHYHDFLELAYVSEGRGVHYIEGEAITVQKGDMFFIPIGTSHIFRPVHEGARNPLILYNCIFSASLFERIVQSRSLFPLSENQLQLLMLLRDQKSWLHMKLLSADVDTLLSRMHLECNLQREGKEFLLISYWMQLIVSVGRAMSGDHAAAEQPVRKKQRLVAALQYIQDHLEAPPSLQEAAALIHISTRQFHRLIKQATNQTYSDYLRTQQIKRSCELLRNTDKKIYEISALSGFPDLKRFYAIFKLKTGLSPTAYRKSGLPFQGDAGAEARELELSSEANQ
ncbi:AraC family transcriptional regulator [Paenibacillus sp. y28]|uniref:AraC family transcriptional regulator n=1 Tax=Paenibacillus sp. y28 TaxID=3129110 RepID=UPI0030169204